MKFFFWNINKHDLSDLIVSFIITENVDVAIFAEASEMDFASLQIKLNGKYRLLGFNEFPGKVRFFSEIKYQSLRVHGRAALFDRHFFSWIVTN